MFRTLQDLTVQELRDVDARLERDFLQLVERRRYIGEQIDANIDKRVNVRREIDARVTEPVS